MTKQNEPAIARAKEATEDERLTMVLVPNAEERMMALAGIGDRAERSARLQALVDELRGTMQEMLERHGAHGIEVVNAMDGQLSMVAAGPASAWRVLFDEEGEALKDIEVILNDPNWEVAST